MKFVSLRTRRAHKKGKLATPSRATQQLFTKPMAAPCEVHTYEELRQQIHDDLRVQHPEWIQQDGNSPMCDCYEARLMKLLDCLARRESTHAIVDPHHLLERGAH